jgi:multiple sugar transport system substrate-binding protein
MNEITFSIFQQSPAASAMMAKLLKQFESEEKIQVRLEVIPWSMGWQRLIEMGLYHIGADISEIGSTWIMDFVHMEALRPYSNAEVKAITGDQRYFDAAWKGGISEGILGPIVWAIPLSGDTRAIFYRRDWLKKAGVDENTAFKGPSRFDHTLEVILKAGCSMPLSLPTGHSRNNIHGLASWIWGLGGDFLSADGTRIEFDRQQALEGFKAYFALGRYLGTQRTIEIADSDAAFKEGRSAATISGPWILHEQKAEEVANKLGIAPVPGTPFVGGEHLIIWKHSHRPEEALRLASFLARPEISNSLYPLFGLPVSDIGWTNAKFSQTGYGYEVFQHAMQNGRCFPNNQLWGLVEKRLSDVLPNIWAEVLAHPERLDSIVENNLSTLAKRLQATLQG